MRELALDTRLLDEILVMPQRRLVPPDGPRVDFPGVGPAVQVGPEPLDEHGVLCLRTPTPDERKCVQSLIDLPRPGDGGDQVAIDPLAEVPLLGLVPPLQDKMAQYAR